MGELAVVAVLAAVWWIPTFICLTDLQQREGVRRVLVWKWTAILCVPTVGAAAYWRRGRPELDADVASRGGSHRQRGHGGHGGQGRAASTRRARSGAGRRAR